MPAPRRRRRTAYVAWLEHDDVQDLEHAQQQTRGAWVYANLTNSLEHDREWAERAQLLLADVEQHLDQALDDLNQVLRAVARQRLGRRR
jgi:hypothetical protein